MPVEIGNSLLAGYQELKEEIDAACRRFFESGWYILGREVEAFESEYAARCGAQHCVGVGSGLDAIHLALRAMKIGEGAEVVVPSNTHIATWLGVTHSGATPIAAEPDPQTYNLDPEAAEKAISARTRAVLAVNLYGLPCDYGALREICKRRGLSFIVDNAQAAGASFSGQSTGGIADVECHSFYPTKNLGAYGEAGAVTTQDSAFAESIHSLRNYGARVRHQNEVVGFNSRLDALQAAILRVKLRHLDDWNFRRRRVAAFYLSALANLPGLTLPFEPPGRTHVWHQFVVRHRKRDDLQHELTKHSVRTDIHYPVPPHRSAVYARYGHAPDALPVANSLAEEVLSLPIGPHFDLKDAERVCELITSFIEGEAKAVS